MMVWRIEFAFRHSSGGCSHDVVANSIEQAIRKAKKIEREHSQWCKRKFRMKSLASYVTSVELISDNVLIDKWAPPS